MDFVQVQFKSRYTNGYGGAKYTYIADVPVVVGDVVNVPTANGDGEALVCRVGIPEEEARRGYGGEFRHITQPATPNGGLFEDFFR